MSIEILARRPYSLKDGDQHLDVVLAHNPKDKITPFVTWVHNKSADSPEHGPSYNWGHYFRTTPAAWRDFLVRNTSLEGRLDG